MRLVFLLATVVFAGLLSFLHQWALAEYLYWQYPWFDIIMHFLGGVTLGTFIAGIARTFRPWWFLSFVVICSLAWEVFELVIGVPRASNFILDTGTDLLMDTFGALFIYSFLRLTLWRSK